MARALAKHRQLRDDLAELEEAVELRTLALIRQARAMDPPMTWAAIGEQLDMTGQGVLKAHQRGAPQGD